jgi:hypothetical protein
MSTPNWDILHTRFATSIRDTVPSASVDGEELSVADRDAYLNSAYSKYIRLIGLYNKESVDSILPELFNTEIITAVSGVAAQPSDLGFLIDIQPSDNAGAVVEVVSALEFLRYKYSQTVQNPSSNSLIRTKVVGSSFYFLPLDYNGSFEVSYIKYEFGITQGGSVDISLEPENWDTIVDFAKSSYYKDKQEYQLAKDIYDEAILESPFKIGEIEK